MAPAEVLQHGRLGPALTQEGGRQRPKAHAVGAAVAQQLVATVAQGLEQNASPDGRHIRKT